MKFLGLLILAFVGLSGLRIDDKPSSQTSVEAFITRIPLRHVDSYIIEASDSEPPLFDWFRAATVGDSFVLAQLHAKFPSILNMKTQGGFTAYNLAKRNSNCAAISTLIALGADTSEPAQWCSHDRIPLGNFTITEMCIPLSEKNCPNKKQQQTKSKK